MLLRSIGCSFVLLVALLAAAPGTLKPGVGAWTLPPRVAVVPTLTGLRREGCAIDTSWLSTHTSPGPKRAGERRRALKTACSLAGPAAGGMPPPEVQALWCQLPAELKRGLRFERMLGSGFFGVVVLAEKERGTADEPTLWADNCDVTGQRLRCDDGSTQVAVKLVKPRPGEEALAMREGLVLSTIQNRASLRDCGLGGGSKCAHIPTCLDYGMCASGLVYTIIEFVPGMPLDKYLKQEGPLPPREVARVGSHICEALSVIHEAGFTYGDLKAENIIRSSTGDMGQVVCRTPLSPTSPPPSPTPHIHICILQAIYRLIDFGSTMGVSGCLFGSTYDARSAAAAHLSTATLASFVVSDVTAPELQVSAPPFATLNPKR